MSKIFKLIFVLLLNLFILETIAQDSTIKLTPVLALKNKQVKSHIDTLILKSKGTNKSNVIFLSFCKYDTCQFFFSACSNKGLACYMITEPEFQSQKLAGYVEISNYDCYVFGDSSVTRFFRQTGETISIPEKFKWLSEVSTVRYADELFNHIDTHSYDPPLYITFDIQRYVYQKGKFEDIRTNSEIIDLFSDFRNLKFLPYRSYYNVPQN